MLDRGVPISWSRGGILRVDTSIYAGRIRDVLIGVDSTRFLKNMSAELLFRNGIIDVGARIQNDNSIVVLHVNSINSAAIEQRSHGFLWNNRGGFGYERTVV